MDESGLDNILMYSTISLLAFAGIGRAVYDRRDGVYPLSILIVVFPGIYYLTHSDLGFRHPIDPVIAIFLAYAVSTAVRQKSQLRAKNTIFDRTKDSVQLWAWSDAGDGVHDRCNMSRVKFKAE